MNGSSEKLVVHQYPRVMLLSPVSLKPGGGGGSGMVVGGRFLNGPVCSTVYISLSKLTCISHFLLSLPQDHILCET